MVQKLRIFVCAPNFAIDKLENANYKNGNRFPKLLSKTPKYGIIGSKFKNSNILHETLQLGKLDGVDYRYENHFWKFQSKDPIEHIWS